MSVCVCLSGILCSKARGILPDLTQFWFYFSSCVYFLTDKALTDVGLLRSPKQGCFRSRSTRGACSIRPPSATFKIIYILHSWFDRTFWRFSHSLIVSHFHPLGSRGLIHKYGLRSAMRSTAIKSMIPSRAQLRIGHQSIIFIRTLFNTLLLLLNPIPIGLLVPRTSDKVANGNRSWDKNFYVYLLVQTSSKISLGRWN